MHDEMLNETAAQMAELLELAGSVEALLEGVDELTLLHGRKPRLVEVVNLLMARRELGMVGAPGWLAPL